MYDKIKTFGKFTIVLLTIVSMAFSGVSVAQADSTYYVGTENTNSAVTYDTIQKAVNAASANATIKVANGTYNTSVEVDTKNITLAPYDASKTVVIDATNESYGDAIFGVEENTVNLHENVTLTENAVYVNTANAPNGATTYNNVSTAFEGISNNTVMYVVPGEYTNESYNVTVENVAISNYNATQNLTFDATNTSEGSVFYGEYADTVRVDSDVTILGEVFASGGSFNLDSGIQTKFFGIPIWAIVVVVGIGGYIYQSGKE